MTTPAAAADAGANLAHAATYLFVPGNRPERFEKASSVGAGAVILDLEDAVPAEHKDAARIEVAARVAAGHRCVVRINATGTPWHDHDLEVLAPLDCSVMVPKAEDPAELDRIATVLGGDRIMALVETARGVLDSARIAATAGVARVAFGSFDLAAELAVEPTDREALLAVRTALVLASAAARLPGPVDGVTAGVHDAAAISDDARYARRLGFAGKLCIHPAQIAPSAEALRPTEEQRAWAQRVLEATAQTDLAMVDGAMVDRPVIERARSILQQFA